MMHKHRRGVFSYNSDRKAFTATLAVGIILINIVRMSRNTQRFIIGIEIQIDAHLCAQRLVALAILLHLPEKSLHLFNGERHSVCGWLFHDAYLNLSSISERGWRSQISRRTTVSNSSSIMT